MHLGAKRVRRLADRSDGDAEEAQRQRRARDAEDAPRDAQLGLALQPLIHEIASTEDILGPLQAIGTKLNAINGIDVTDVRNGIKSLAGGNSGHVEPVSAIKIR